MTVWFWVMFAAWFIMSLAWLGASRRATELHKIEGMSAHLATECNRLTTKYEALQAEHQQTLINMAVLTERLRIYDQAMNRGD